MRVGLFSGTMTGRRLLSLFLYLMLGAGFVYFITESSLYNSTRFARTGFIHPIRSLQLGNVSYTEESIRALIASVNSSILLNILAKQAVKAGEQVGQVTVNTAPKSTVQTVNANATGVKPKDTKPDGGVKTTTTTATTTTTTKGPAVAGNATNVCPETPPNLKGKWVPRLEIVDWTVQEGKHPELSAGGRWKPTDCTPRHKVAILIAYRGRDEHLHIFMNNMHDFLQRQQLDYGIYVVEQAGTGLFNRAMLFNVGFAESLKDYDWQCHVLHDVDHIPLNDKNLYTCPPRPRHLSAAIKKWGFRQPYRNFFGGVSMMKAEHYKKINGMSNQYWGWGGEDDDFYYRCTSKGLVPIMRYPPNIASYMTVQTNHKRAPSNGDRMKLLGAWRKRQDTDGLSDLKYTVVKKDQKKLYTHLVVDIGHLKRR